MASSTRSGSTARCHAVCFGFVCSASNARRVVSKCLEWRVSQAGGPWHGLDMHMLAWQSGRPFSTHCSDSSETNQAKCWPFFGGVGNMLGQR